ncbi:NADPH:quinone reductase [Aquisalimonas sp.]|uniref:NADPH:quinone reductase n=1 Tax=unclassified Aquisalimonas TaxID=2644645 RepID=UPI0025BD883E|nr:NADPH:quinone reductase [Aquisalimonas sp.]
MRAAHYERVGPAADVLTVSDIPTPEPGPGEVRVRLHTSGVNPSDVKTRAGARSRDLPFPRIIPHSDGAGVVDAVGSDVTAHTAGQRVWVWNAAWGRPDGTAADYVVLPERQVVTLPENVDMAAGACLGIPALTAFHAVNCHGGVRGQSVLIAGGAGAVSWYAIQMARQAGAARIMTTVSSAEKAAVAREAGADEVINYREEDVAQRVMALTGDQGADRIVELEFAANAAVDVAALRPNGLIVAYGASAGEVTLPFFPSILKNVLLQFFIVYNLPEADHRAAIDGVMELLQRDALRHRVAERRPLEQIAEAHALVEQGQVVGNVVLELG